MHPSRRWILGEGISLIIRIQDKVDTGQVVALLLVACRAVALKLNYWEMEIERRKSRRRDANKSCVIRLYRQWQRGRNVN